MKRSTRRKAVFLAGFGAYFAALLFFWGSPVVYPLKVFVVFLHEISHGVAAVATGGAIREITLDPRLGGACYCPGGNAFVTLSAGYLGSVAWGGLLLEATRRFPERAGGILVGVGTMVVVLTLLFVRTSFGLGFGVLFGGGLVATGTIVAPATSRILLYGLGLTSCLYAILDIQADVLARPHLPSDAAMLSELTGIPTVVWGILWIALAVVASGFFFVRAYRSA